MRAQQESPAAEVSITDLLHRALQGSLFEEQRVFYTGHCKGAFSRNNGSSTQGTAREPFRGTFRGGPPSRTRQHPICSPELSHACRGSCVVVTVLAVNSEEGQDLRPGAGAGARARAGAGSHGGVMTTTPHGITPHGIASHENQSECGRRRWGG